MGDPKRRGGSNLDDWTAIWPTPTASLTNDGENPQTFEARRQRNLAKGLNGNGMGVPLTMAVKTWPTPTASGGEKAPTHYSRGPSNPSLGLAVKMWPTPAASDAQGRGYTRDGGEKGRERPALSGMAASLSSLLDLLTTRHGSAPSNRTPRLNPLFVEWLMGLPSGWTDCDCSATEWFRWKRRMHTELSKLPCPLEMERGGRQPRLL